jgi:hypothetical protein
MRHPHPALEAAPTNYPKFPRRNLKRNGPFYVLVVNRSAVSAAPT